MHQPTKTYVSADGSAVWVTGVPPEDVQSAYTDAVMVNSAAMVSDCAKRTLKDTPNVGANELYGTLALAIQALDDVLRIAMDH